MAYSRDTQQTAFPRKDLDYFRKSESLALLEEQKQTWVHVPTPSTYHQSFQRSEPHGGVYAPAMLDRGCAAPISEMGRNKLQLAIWLSQSPGGFQRHVLMTGA